MKTATYVDSYLMSAYYKSSAHDPEIESKIEAVVANCNGTAPKQTINYSFGGEFSVKCIFPSREDAERARCLLRPATSGVSDPKLFSAAEQEIKAHTEAIRALLPDIEIQPDHQGIYGFARELFARFGMVIIETCSLEDVQEVRSDLTDAQAFDVLEQIKRDVTSHCSRTVNNGVIEYVAEPCSPATRTNTTRTRTFLSP